jgi:hypothetical protein
MCGIVSTVKLICTPQVVLQSAALFFGTVMAHTADSNPLQLTNDAVHNTRFKLVNSCADQRH